MAHAVARIGRDQYRTEIEAGGHTLIADEPERMGGKNVGPAPYDLLLSALGACTAITLRMYAERKEWPLEAVLVDLTLSGDKDHRKVDRVLHITGLDEAQAARLADVAERTPVTLTLKQGIAIDTRLG